MTLIATYYLNFTNKAEALGVESRRHKVAVLCWQVQDVNIYVLTPGLFIVQIHTF